MEDRPDLEAEILRTYRRKYPILAGLVIGRRIRRRLARKESVVIRITPALSSGARPADAPAS